MSHYGVNRSARGCKRLARLAHASLIVGVSLLGSGLQSDALAQNSRSGEARSSGRILHGREVQRGQAPWAVSVREDGKHFCGGTLVSPRIVGNKVEGWKTDDTAPNWVVTAAHCVVDDNGKITDEKRIGILGGARSIETGGGGELQAVKKVFVHANYNINTLENDIALLLLEAAKQQQIGQGDRKSIRLPKVSDGVWLNQPFTALITAGWGRTQSGFGSSVLMEVMLPRVGREHCAEKYSPYGDYIGPGMICAGFVSGEYDSCQGDSGGGLFYRPAQDGSIYARSSEPILAGVVSWGRGCGNADLFGVYTSASVYTDWIEKQIHAHLTQ